MKLKSPIISSYLIETVVKLKLMMAVLGKDVNNNKRLMISS